VLIIRRLLFAVGAVLLIGGWGFTGFVALHQHAAGDYAEMWWFEGVELPAVDRPLGNAAGRRAGWPAGSIVHGDAGGRGSGPPSLEQVFQMLEGESGEAAPSHGTGPAGPQAGRRALWPSMLMHLGGVVAMAVGAGLVALAGPWWAGESGGGAYESAAHMPLRLQRGP
jgi:hypothetical protein